MAVAIVLDAAALVIWDVGTRSPGRLLNDVRAGLASVRVLLGGLGRLAIGGTALATAAVLCASLAVTQTDFTVLECGALVTALVLEQLVGPDVRAFFRASASGKRSDVQ